MHDFLNVIMLAVLQGVAEFLPISSSGHLVIAQSLLGIKESGVRLEVVLHLGTMVSIMLYYRRQLTALVTGALRLEREALKMCGYILLSCIPATFFYTICHDRVDRFFEDTQAVGGFLVFTGVILCALRWMHPGNGSITAPRALLVGLAQAIAVLPGVSRSGMTIAAARMAGIAPRKTAEFSFLMCLPLLVGAALIDMARSFSETAAAPQLGWPVMLAGAAVAAVVGYFALVFLVRTLEGGRFWLFGIYCIIAGLLTATLL